MNIASVAIPVYNCEKTIKKSLASVLNQSFSDIEILIWDDGCTDQTIEIIKSFSDDRIKLYQEGKNKGVAYGLNRLIEQASGEYFVRMDGDDIMFPDRLEKQIRFLKEHPEVDVVGAPAIVIDESDHIIGIRGEIQKEWSRDDLFCSSRFVHPTVIGRTEFFRRWKYDETLSGCEDMDLWIRGYGSSVYADYDEPLLFYKEYLKMRLNTYLYRQRLLLEYAWRNRNKMERSKLFPQLMVKSVVSSIAAIVAHLCRCDEKLIRRRNRRLTQVEFEKYSSILGDIEMRH